MSEHVPQLATRLALTVAEAAVALGVSERHLRQLLPELPHVHLGGRVVIPVDGLRDYLREAASREAKRQTEIVRELANFGTK